MSASTRLEAALDRQEIAEFVVTNSMLADGGAPGDWERYRQRYAEAITIDYSSTLADPPKEISRDLLMPYWKSLIDAFDITQHIVSNLVVTLDGDNASCRSYVISNHRIGGDVWSCGGIYDHGLRRASGTDGGWLITAQRFSSLFETGDRSVFERGIAKAIPSPLKQAAAKA
ncbi:MAG: nuclear transport factor 2 family protein [Hydrocarboniphaga sp.]|uniref:nuclear transport factor 2 family protein n=1 Tax=Hydrocarboniphaga sp. TaxID=2033016 RepID=UPI002620AEBF|nr:nuclear transport factor 2 family protein [Hydrocarboniphaga sp.]MDB5968007.1 nuclear transport factor 2 family protein [Hydrocarboniphaga sp.]